MTKSTPKLKKILQSALEACHPARCLPPFLPPPPENGKLIILGAGKASAAMAATAEEKYLTGGLTPASGKLIGTVATRHGYGVETQLIKIQQAGHPIPDDASVKAAGTALQMAAGACPDDLILVLLSGGASALWCAPIAGVSLMEKQSLTSRLLRSGMPIEKFNTIRKHLSSIKGGRLARAANSTSIVTLAISDVPGDIPSAIGSGPTLADDSTLNDARAALAGYNVAVDDNITQALANPDNETPKPGDEIFANCSYQIIATAKDALNAAARKAEQFGYRPLIIGDAIEGEAREIAIEHAVQALEKKRADQPTALISGGELTVTVRGNGIGGPNQEYALALLHALGGTQGISAIAADTDGSDGGTGDKNDPAGAIFTPESLNKAKSLNLNPAIFLENNDSSTFFRSLDSLIVTGPTQTNVNDIRIILIDP